MILLLIPTRHHTKFWPLILTGSLGSQLTPDLFICAPLPLNYGVTLLKPNYSVWEVSSVTSNGIIFHEMIFTFVFKSNFL